MKISYLCPVCSSTLGLIGKSYMCDKRHTFDMAKEGYVNFAIGKSDGGDSAEMCASRRRFLAAGYYEKFSGLINKTLKEYIPDAKALLDAGCGEGYYLRGVRKDYPEAELFGIDLAKEAVRLAAKSEKQVPPERQRNSYCVGGIFELPFENGCFDGVLSVFAPVGDAENHRVLRDGGYMFVAGPGKTHLSGLKSAVYDVPYDNPEKHREFDGFCFEGKTCVEYEVTVDGEFISDLFTMTPYYWKTSKKDAAKLEELSSLSTALSFEISVYKRI